MAILAAVLVPTITNKINDANESAAKSDCSSMISNVQSGVVSYLSDTTNKTFAQQGITVAGTTYSAPTSDGTYVYGAETTGFVVVTKKGNIIFWGTVDKNGTTTAPVKGGTPALPSSPSAGEELN